MPLILGIESSCDETAAAVLRNGFLLANVVAGQEVHKQWGGVIPELASRAHQQQVVPVVHEALRQAGVQPHELDGIAYTQGPGLLGALLVGGSFAKAFSLALNKPLLAVNHMQGHILAHFVRDNDQRPVPEFPFLCLTVSGGHTQLVRVDDARTFVLIGETIDDAAGEAFDKCAKILGLPYPGGPLIDKYAATGNPNAFAFPEGQVPGLNFSFSGLKTAVLYFVRDHTAANPDFVQNHLHDICASIQHTIVSTLIKRLKRAVKETGITRVALAGGVSANSGLRQALTQTGQTEGWQTFIPPFAYCTDNAAMIAMAGHFQLLAGETAAQDTPPLPRFSL
ncbi:MAG: tRNA (adenosine(37)-N6)-threonylcarbamoyltransferase complex transferase subunit TsaD [Bacteroidia bacterium]|jgi:N6-L-threonylcarbamoyladenine synthase|nr:tRNA (adenosine(37)-N6)-threonylcarbamoyltransferase complex transferase subunit TsaD [Bacteroidia bacterium]